MANFCTNCGTKLRSDDNFCYNCGARMNNPCVKQNSSYSDGIDKKDAKKELKRVAGGRFISNKDFDNALHKNGLDITHGMAIKKQVEEEIDSGQLKSGGVEFRINQLISEHKIKNDEINRKVQRIDSVLACEDISSEIRSNNIGQSDINLIKSMLKAKIIDQNEDMSDEDIKDYIRLSIKTHRKVRKAAAPSKPVISHEPVRNEMSHGGYCDLDCRHCYEEFLDSYGGIVGDFDAEGYVEYYCVLGYQVAFGRFCEYYE